jgi:hypothetical protein
MPKLLGFGRSGLDHRQQGVDAREEGCGLVL